MLFIKEILSFGGDHGWFKMGLWLLVHLLGSEAQLWSLSLLVVSGLPFGIEGQVLIVCYHYYDLKENLI